MVVAVVEVGNVRMGVDERLVTVGMGVVRGEVTGRVGMIVVAVIVVVLVLVLDWPMLMRVLVLRTDHS